MKNRSWEIVFGIYLLSSSFSFSQKISSEFQNILNDTILSVEEKDVVFQNLLKRHKSQNNSDLLLGDAYEIIKWYRRQGFLNSAISLNKENIKLMESLEIPNTTFYRRNLYSLGFYQRKNDSLDNAIETFKKLLIYKTPDKYAIQGAFQTAELYFINGKYHLSKDYHNLSKTIAEDLDNPVFTVRNATGIAQASKRINTTKSLNEGIKILIQAIAFAEDLNNNASGDTIINLYYLYDMYNQLGNLYIDRLDYDFVNGKINLEKALDIAKTLDDSTLLHKTYNDLGLLYLNIEKKEAEAFFIKALEYEPNVLMKSLINRNLSIHYLNFNDYESSLYHIQTAITTLVNFDNSSVTNLPSKIDLSNSVEKFKLISALIDKANIWIKLGEEDLNNKDYLINSIKTLELADFLIEQTRIENIDRRSKLFWQKTASEIYLKATKTCFLLNNPKKAFYFIEKNKALLLLEDTTLKSTKSKAKIPEAIITEEQNLKNTIIKLEQLANSKNKNGTQSKLLLARTNYNEFINTLSPNYKLYFKTVEPIKVISIDKFRKEFSKDNNAYVEYILDDEEGYGIAITKSDIKLFEIKDCKALRRNVTTYRNLIDKPIKNKTSQKHFSTISNVIYKTLFPYEINALINNNTLTIIPDYYLQNIPFESLTTSNKDFSYLIYKNQINYAYSLTYLIENTNNQEINSGNVVAFAPVNFSTGLTSLPNTEKELHVIDYLFTSQLYLKTKATKQNFIKESKDAKILHIASHANANDSIGPWISFYNSKINLNDIYSLNNSAELVVLSACNTSLGELHKGEGIMSLSRGFFYAGSKTVISTLWEINDKSSTELLDSFYKNINLGENKSSALRNAKLNYLKTHSLSDASPYYWASFILIGDTEKIEFDNHFSTIYYFILGFILLIVIAFFFRIQKKPITNG